MQLKYLGYPVHAVECPQFSHIKEVCIHWYNQYTSINGCYMLSARC